MPEATPEHTKVQVSWHSVEEAISMLHHDLQSSSSIPPPKLIIGITRGGVIPAALLHRHYPSSVLQCIHPLQLQSNLDLIPDSGYTWIIDDIWDSGRTLIQIHDLLPHATYATLWSKHLRPIPWLHSPFWIDPKYWVVFPWEAVES